MELEHLEAGTVMGRSQAGDLTEGQKERGEGIQAFGRQVRPMWGRERSPVG